MKKNKVSTDMRELEGASGNRVGDKVIKHQCEGFNIFPIRVNDTWIVGACSICGHYLEKIESKELTRSIK